MGCMQAGCVRWRISIYNYHGMEPGVAVSPETTLPPRTGDTVKVMPMALPLPLMEVQSDTKEWIDGVNLLIVSF